jgi:hypothetical protein
MGRGGGRMPPRPDAFLEGSRVTFAPVRCDQGVKRCDHAVNER